MSLEKQYIALYSQHEEALKKGAPEKINATRAQAMDDFKRSGFPTLKVEDYRYIDVQALFDAPYRLALQGQEGILSSERHLTCGLSTLHTYPFFYHNGLPYPVSQTADELPKGLFMGTLKQFMQQYPTQANRYYGELASTANDAIAAINSAFVQDGFVLYLPKGVRLERPVQLVNISESDSDVMANRRILVIMEADTEAQLLVCDHSIGKKNYLLTQVTELFVDEHAHFSYYEMEESSRTTKRLSSLYSKQEANSQLFINCSTLTNGITRNNYKLLLNGEHAEATISGMAIADQQQQAHTHSEIIHAVPHCTSTELFKKVLDDEALGAFCGRIIVKEGADKTMAYQTNRNMCLTRKTRMYSKPQLEIYADDVKCSHGMSTGQLNEQALFYMQSRGISLEEAKMMLRVAFMADVLELVHLEELRERLLLLVEKRFRGEPTRCALNEIC